MFFQNTEWHILPAPLDNSIHQILIRIQDLELDSRTDRCHSECNTAEGELAYNGKGRLVHHRGFWYLFLHVRCSSAF